MCRLAINAGFSMSPNPLGPWKPRVPEGQGDLGPFCSENTV